MSNATLLDFLRQYTTDIPPSIQQGIIEEIPYDSNFNRVTFITRFANIVPYADILHFEQSAGVALGVPQLRLDCRYDAALFTQACIPDLVSMLKRELPIINGFLNKATWNWQEEHIHIDLQNGGRPILEKFQFAKVFSDFVALHFGKTITVSISGPDMIY